MSIKKQIGENVALCVIYFIILSVLNKLFLKQEDWLYNSIVTSIFLVIGRFIAKKIVINLETRKDKIIGIITCIVSMFLIVAFIIGVVLNIPTWGKIVLNIITPFAVGMFINTKYN